MKLSRRARHLPIEHRHRPESVWKRGFYWHYVIFALIIHGMVLLAPWTFSWGALAAAVTLYFLCGCIGVTLTYHRMLAHRSFDTFAWCKVIGLTFGAWSASGDVITWVGQHRVHHTYSDQDGDMHSPRHGFNWAHLLWPFVREPEAWSSRDYAMDLDRSPLVRFFDRYGGLALLGLAAGLYGAGQWLEGNGWGWLVWGMGVRLAFTWHATWMVNSVCHTWGYRSFETEDDSRNNWLVGMLTFGEGFHNNHHAEPRCAAHGREPVEFDLTYRIIRCMEHLGLAWNVVHPNPSQTSDQANPSTVSSEPRHA